MKVTEILDAYNNLSFKDKVLFEQGFNRLKAEEKLRMEEKRKQIANTISSMTKDDSPYFSAEWVKNKILKSK
jgi:hypothetical protein